MTAAAKLVPTDTGKRLAACYSGRATRCPAPRSSIRGMVGWKLKPELHWGLALPC